MDLQQGLLLAGLVIIGATVALSLYERARRHGPVRRPPALEDEASGVLKTRAAMTAPPVTATLDINPSPAVASGKRALKSDAVTDGEPARRDSITEELEALEDTATTPLTIEPGVPKPRTQPAEPAAPDEKIDFILNLPGEGPVERDAALGLYKQEEYRLEKPRRLYGRRQQTDFWSDLARDPQDTRYSDLALTLQLVDGRGPVDESELNAFSQLGLKLADALHRPTRFSASFEQALARAQELQVFCQAYDVIAGINVIAKDGAFQGRAVEQAAARAGLKFGAGHIFHMKKTELTPGCRHLFSLANLFQPGEFNPTRWDHFETQGLALFMSVPCAHHPASVFVKMVTAAKVVAEALGGELRDQDRRPLTDKGLAIIRKQIEEIEKRMRDYGVVPGSRTALRLFRESMVT